MVKRVGKSQAKHQRFSLGDDVDWLLLNHNVVSWSCSGYLGEYEGPLNNDLPLADFHSMYSFAPDPAVYLWNISVEDR